MIFTPSVRSDCQSSSFISHWRKSLIFHSFLNIHITTTDWVDWLNWGRDDEGKDDALKDKFALKSEKQAV